MADLRRLQGDDRILWGVVANAGRHCDRPIYRWAAVMEATGQGSTAAFNLCVRFGFDPDEYVGAAREQGGQP